MLRMSSTDPLRPKGRSAPGRGRESQVRENFMVQWMKHGLIILDAVHAIEHQTVKMNIEVRGRAETFDQSHRAGMGFTLLSGRGDFLPSNP